MKCRCDERAPWPFSFVKKKETLKGKSGAAYFFSQVTESQT